MSGALSYDPVRIERLRCETLWAAGALLGLRSPDPAADGAAGAIGALHRVLDAHWLPAIATVQRLDPLSGGLRTPTATVDQVRHPNDRGGAPAAPGPYDDWSIAELLAEFDRLDRKLPHDDDLRPDLDDPFWIEFAALADELASRVTADPALADEIVAGARANPLLAIAAGCAAFPRPMIQAMAIELLQATSHVDDLESRYAAHAAELLLRSLLPHPDLALGVIVDRVALRELIQWPLIDADLAAEFIDIAMRHPVDDPSRLDDGLTALEHFVAFANQRLFEQGFPPPFSVVIAAGVARYLPTFVDSLEPGDDVALRPPHRVTSEEFIDLIGALLYDPDAAEVLVGAVRSMAILSQLPGSPFDLSDVGDFALALTDGAENERLEAELRAAASRTLVQQLTVVLGFVAGSMAAAQGWSSATRSIVSRIVNGGGDVAERLIRADDTGIGDPSATLESLIELTVCETFLADPDLHRDPTVPLDHAVLSQARAAATEIADLVAAGAPPTLVDDRLRELQRLVKSMGGADHLEALDTGSIRELDRRESEPDT